MFFYLKLASIILIVGFLYGFYAWKTGRKVIDIILWVFAGIFSIPIIALLVFLLLSNYYPCNGEECLPLNYAIAVGCISSILTGISLVYFTFYYKKGAKSLK